MASDDTSCHGTVQLSDLIMGEREPEIMTPIYPGLGCGFFAVSMVIPTIYRSCAVMIAPALCAHNARLMVSRWEHSSADFTNNLVFFLYEEDDIIHGASERIREGLFQVYEKNKPEILFVVTSCLPEIVGEDIEAVVRQTGSKLPIPVLFIRTENFTNVTARQGMEHTYESILELMEKPEIQELKSVNIIGAFSRDVERTELAGILQKAGFSINVVFPSYCDMETLKKVPKAGYNILVNRSSSSSAEIMKKRFNLPYYLFDQAFTPEAIRTQYHELGIFLGTDLGPFVKYEYEKYLHKISSVKEIVSGKSAIVSWNSGRVFDLALLFVELGLTIPVIATNELTSDDISDANRLNQVTDNVEVIRNIASYFLEEKIATIKPDYYFAFGGPDPRFCAGNGVLFRHIARRPYLNGFEAANRILDSLLMNPAGYSTLMLAQKIRSETVV